jgi:hypothetical protein
MNAKERYKNAQEAAREGRYEEALREHIWFHDNALAEQPSLYGVRLSYALADWVELGKVYRPALVALRAVRDEKSAKLQNGDGDRALFHDVRAINESLTEHESTYRLFVQLMKANPPMAKECADLAIPSIVHAKDFDLARTFIDNPEGAVRNWSRLLNEDVADLAKEPPRKAPVQEAYVHYYVERVRILLAVLVGVGDLTLAESIRQTDVTSIESDSVRDAVDAALASDSGV